MTESVWISDEFYEYVASHSREDETIEETLRRLVGYPNPEDVAGILSADAASEMREWLNAKREADVAGKRTLRRRLD